MSGKEMYKWAEDLFPICRSITGNGVRETLSYLKKIIPSMNIMEVPSGSIAFDWTVPKEWKIIDAYIEDDSGRKIVDFKENNLHVVGYSASINKIVNLGELDKHLYSLPSQPDAIPYVTSYYNEKWGFCLTHNKRLKLKEGLYKVVVESEMFNGVLNYGEVLVPGQLQDEVFISTYVCHPSMANNELSGPVVTTNLVKWILNLEKRRYTYRVVFVPETIGSIVYLSKNLDEMKGRVVAGFNVTCVGDNRCYSYLPTRMGGTYSDEIALHVLKEIDPNFRKYKWNDRGSDERQYCSPGVDLPVVSIMRSKYNEYPEYHTSQDDLNLISPEGLWGGYEALKTALEIVEKNYYPKSKYLCEPQLGKRGLYPSISTKETKKQVAFLMDVVSMCDSKHSILDIANLNGVAFEIVFRLCEELKTCGVLG